MNTSTNLHIGDDDEINCYSEAGGRRITVFVGTESCAWLHLTPAAARRLAAVLADALAEVAP